MKTDPFKPSKLLLIKLGALAVHADEIVETHGVNLDFDGPAVKTLMDDAEVQQWIKDMGPMLPLKRSAYTGKKR